MPLVSDYEIRRRAFELWDADGRPEGRALDYWLAAEAELQGRARALDLEHEGEGVNIQLVEGGGDVQAQSGRAQSTTWPEADPAAQQQDGNDRSAE